MAPANSVAKLPVLLANVLARPLIKPAYRGAKSFGLLLIFFYSIAVKSRFELSLSKKKEQKVT